MKTIEFHNLTINETKDGRLDGKFIDKELILRRFGPLAQGDYMLDIIQSQTGQTEILQKRESPNE